MYIQVSSSLCIQYHTSLAICSFLAYYISPVSAHCLQTIYVHVMRQVENLKGIENDILCHVTKGHCYAVSITTNWSQKIGLYQAKTSCNQVVIDSAMILLRLNLPYHIHVLCDRIWLYMLHCQIIENTVHDHMTVVQSRGQSAVIAPSNGMLTHPRYTSTPSLH